MDSAKSNPQQGERGRQGEREKGEREGEGERERRREREREGGEGVREHKWNTIDYESSGTGLDSLIASCPNLGGVLILGASNIGHFL